jgi:hypothetical protein
MGYFDSCHFFDTLQIIHSRLYSSDVSTWRLKRGVQSLRNRYHPLHTLAKLPIAALFAGPIGIYVTF